MDILLYKDGHLSISESPLQGKENNLDDVVMLVSNPQDGDTLTYKGGKWVNGEGGGGGGGGAGIFTVAARPETDKLVLDHTAREILTAAENGTPIYLMVLISGEDYFEHSFGFLVAVNGSNGDGTVGFSFSMSVKQVSGQVHGTPEDVADIWSFDVPFQSLDDYPSMANDP